MLKRHANEWKLSYFEFAITSPIHRQTTMSFDTCLILATKNDKKIETVAWSPYFSTWTFCFYKQRSVFRHVLASHLQNVCCLNLAFGLRKKNYISSYIWPRSFIQTVKRSLLDKKIFYQSFYGALLKFRYFLLWGKVLCFARVGMSLANCLFRMRSKELVEKNISFSS